MSERQGPMDKQMLDKAMAQLKRDVHEYNAHQMENKSKWRVLNREFKKNNKLLEQSGYL